MKKQSKRPSKKPLLIATAIVVAALGLGLYVWLKPAASKHPQTASSNVPSNLSTGYSKPTQSTPTVADNSTPTPNPNVPGGSTGSQDTVAAALVAPSGTFVSNHMPGLYDQEQSSCSTTPGANCDVSFSNGSTTIDLGSRTMPSSGSKDGASSVTWSWSPSSINLTSEQWKITATATLNGQTKTTQDPTPLQVR